MTPPTESSDILNPHLAPTSAREEGSGALHVHKLDKFVLDLSYLVWGGSPVKLGAGTPDYCPTR